MGKARFLDSLVIADKYLSGVKEELSIIKRIPSVKMFLATSDLGSEVYSKTMSRTFSEVGIDSTLMHVETAKDLEEKILATKDEEVTGCFVFYPIGFSEAPDRNFMRIVPQFKDIEGLSVENIYRLIHYQKQFQGTPCNAVVPCTPKAVIKLLIENNIKTRGKNITIINKSYALGIPLRQMFDNLGATVTACDINTHSDSLRRYVKGSDIIVTAVPSEIELFNEEDVKSNSTVINCSFHNNFDPEKISNVVENISYRRGSNYIGRATTAMAAVNVLYLLKHQIFQEENSL